MKTRSPLSASAGFQQHDLGFVGEHGAATRSDDGMVINDQNAHWHWSRIPASVPLLHRIRLHEAPAR